MSNQGMVFRIQKDKEVVSPDVDGRPDGEGEEGQGVSLKEAPLGTQSEVKAPEEIKTEAGVREIVLRAPLGHAVTEALKMLLNRDDNKTGTIRQENMMAQLLVNEITEEDDLGPADKDKAYVYVQDGRKMNLGEIDAIMNAAMTQMQSDAGFVGVFVDGLEDTLKTDPNKGEFISQGALHMESCGIKVMYGRLRFMTAVEDWVKG